MYELKEVGSIWWFLKGLWGPSRDPIFSSCPSCSQRIELQYSVSLCTFSVLQFLDPAYAAMTLESKKRETDMEARPAVLMAPSAYCLVTSGRYFWEIG